MPEVVKLKVPVAAGATRIGYKDAGARNQDAFELRTDGAGLVIAAVADGVGSLPDSGDFARAAVDGVVAAFDRVKALHRSPMCEAAPASSADPAGTIPGSPRDPALPGAICEFESLGEDSPVAEAPVVVDDAAPALPDLHRVIRDSVKASVDALAEKSGATTLLYVVVDADSVAWGRVGDGAIVLLPSGAGAIQVRTMPGKIYTSTDVLDPQNIDAEAWEVGTMARGDLAMVLLMTDGISDALEDPLAFFAYLEAELAGLCADATRERLEELLAKFPIVHGDDKTIMAIRLADGRTATAGSGTDPEEQKDEQSNESEVNHGIDPGIDNREALPPS